jgi:hypothetical protein
MYTEDFRCAPRSAPRTQPQITHANGGRARVSAPAHRARGGAQHAGVGVRQGPPCWGYVVTVLLANMLHHHAPARPALLAARTHTRPRTVATPRAPRRMRVTPAMSALPTPLRHRPLLPPNSQQRQRALLTPRAAALCCSRTPRPPHACSMPTWLPVRCNNGQPRAAHAQPLRAALMRAMRL